MSQILQLLEVLWASERIQQSQSLSTSAKRIITEDLLASLPDERFAPQVSKTLLLIKATLNPPSIDEEPSGKKAILPQRPPQVQKETKKN